jgi:hypothetical protein
MLSPCTKFLDKRRSSPTPPLLKKHDIYSQVAPCPFPGGDLEFILGTSSFSRKLIADLLGWKYTQMAPDIDGPSSIYVFGCH